MKIKRNHKWQVTPREAIEIQHRLQKRICISSFSGKVCLVAGADASFSRHSDTVHGAVCILAFPDFELIEKRTATLKLRFPYIPGLLTFREGPVLLKCFEKLQNLPDVILFDGQGIMHPRRMGIAAHLGVLLDIPSVGCAKSRLYGEFKEPAGSRGSYEYVRDRDGKIIGACLGTREKVKPVFVSVGNRINLSKAIDIVLRSCPKYRIPEPLRCAHTLAGTKKPA
jgi:deoxyribonuclease V